MLGPSQQVELAEACAELRRKKAEQPADTVEYDVPSRPGELIIPRGDHFGVGMYGNAAPRET